MHNTTKLITNHIFCHLMLIPAFMYGAWWWQDIAIIAISGGYHRYYSHKTYKCSRWYQVLMNALGIFAGAGPALTWAAVHKQHHAYSDKELDPHSFHHKGWFAVYVNTWGYDVKIKRKFIKTLWRDDVLNWFYKYYFKLNIAIIVLFTAIDPLLMVFGYAMPVLLAFHGYGILNILGHRNGPSNSAIANVLTAGEGWHANHHAKPGSYEIGHKWWQFDPTKLYIRTFFKREKGELNAAKV